MFYHPITLALSEHESYNLHRRRLFLYLKSDDCFIFAKNKIAICWTLGRSVAPCRLPFLAVFVGMSRA